MSSEYFTRTSLYFVRLKIFEWMKFPGRNLHQIQGNWAGRNLVTESRVNSRLISHARMHRRIWKLQLPTGSWGVRLTWLDCNNYILMEELTTAERQWRCWGTAPCHAAEPFLWSLAFGLLVSRETLLHESNKIFVEHAQDVAKIWFRTWGLFLESLHNFSGPKANF